MKRPASQFTLLGSFVSYSVDIDNIWEEVDTSAITFSFIQLYRCLSFIHACFIDLVVVSLLLATMPMIVR